MSIQKNDVEQIISKAIQTIVGLESLADASAAAVMIALKEEKLRVTTHRKPYSFWGPIKKTKSNT